MKQLALPLVACLALGCGLDFTDPVLDTAATLTVSVAVVDSQPAGKIRLSGRLWPGYNVQGSVRVLTNPSLEVLGRTVLPYAGYQADSPDPIGYSEEWPFSPVNPLGPVELRGPGILAIGPTPVLRLTPPWPAGPASVTVPRDSALKLDLAVAPEPGDTVLESWRLDLVKDGQYLSQLSANGPAPATIQVPWAMLAGLAGAGQARLTVTQSVSTPGDGRRYWAGLSVLTTHVWSVTVEP
jgi:hypothetical protein